MGPTVEDILKTAMQMSPAGHARLADQLVRTLEAEMDSEIGRAWDQETARRWEELDSGASQPIPLDAVRERLRRPKRENR